MAVPAPPRRRRARGAARPDGLRYFLENGDLDYVVEALLKRCCCRAWRDAARERFGGAAVCAAFLSTSGNIGGVASTTEEVLALAERFFGAMGRRDVTIRGRRFVLLADGDEGREASARSKRRTFLHVDRRQYAENVATQVPPKVEHFVCEHGHTIINEDRFLVANGDLHSAWLPSALVVCQSAFCECARLASVSLPAAAAVGDWAFVCCRSLESISLPAASTVGYWAFGSCWSLRSVSLPAVTTIDNSAFADCGGLTAVSLPTAQTVYQYAFSRCRRLSTVSLPSATTICGLAFSDCENLTSVSLPAATTIGGGAFSECKSLTSIDLPAATEVGQAAFRECTNLTSISLPVATEIQDWTTFDTCTSLVTLVVPRPFVNVARCLVRRKLRVKSP